MNLSSYIDHTILAPDASPEAVTRVCREAMENGFWSVCVNPVNVALVSSLLEGSDVKVTSVVGFPLGATTTAAKVFETRRAIEEGADEIDMVINIAALKAGDDTTVLEDISGVVEALNPGTLLKVIIETCLLDDEEKRRACQLSMLAGAHYVKTSTGFSKGGATEADVSLMRSVVGDKLGVKASGGIRNAETAMRMIEAGASRLGASASVAIVQGETSTDSY